MHIRTLAKYTAILVIAALLAACNARPGQLQNFPGNTNPPQAQPTSTSIPATPTAQSPAELCANALVPVKQGASWTYADASAAGSPAHFTATITEVRADGFTVTTMFDDNTTVDQQWACKPEGLVAQSLGAGQAGFGLSLAGIQAKVATSNATGVTVPATVQPGMKWPYSIDLTGTLAQGSLSADVAGGISTDFENLGSETVTVPAGTFNATKIQGTSTIQVAANYHGLRLPITSVVKTTFWFAPGVGWVKSTESGELAGTAVNDVTELQSYSIP